MRDVLTAQVGLLRTEAGLRAALDALAPLAHRERRGAHWRADLIRTLPWRAT